MKTPECEFNGYSYPLLTEARKRLAVSFIGNLSNPEDLRLALDSLNDTITFLLWKAADSNSKEQEELIDQLYYITNVADALIYLASNNPINLNSHG